MKRFVTYLYEYERGNKSKNVGFIRVNVRNTKTDMQVCIRNSSRANEVGKAYAIIHKKDLLGIELGELKILNGQSDESVVFEAENIMSSGHTVSEIVGVGIRLQSGDYFASCWQDEFAEEIARGRFRTQDVLVEREEGLEEKNIFEDDSDKELPYEQQADLEMSLEVAEEAQLEEQDKVPNNNYGGTHTSENVTYEKIDLSKIRNLPSPNWHLSTNSFLVHGFWNYGYLVLKKEMEADKEMLSLGVPGIFEKPEAVMAILFGFPNFQEVPSEMEMNQDPTFSDKEKNQEPKVGTFGCWFVELKN